MNAAVDALSAALVHALWQQAIVGLLLMGALIVLRHRTANARYAACCVALLAMAALPVATAIVVYAPSAAVAASMPPSHVAASPIVVEPLPINRAPRFPADTPGPDYMTLLRSWMLPVWLTGVLLFSTRLALASTYTVALRRRSTPADPAIVSTVARLAARVGVGRLVAVRMSNMTPVPATCGWLRPVILLPAATSLGVTPLQLEALVAHELAHIRRHDYLVNLLQMLVETLFFYHPVVWLASQRTRTERELCCDDIAVDVCGDAVGYARALTIVARRQLVAQGLAVGAGDGALVQRVRRLVGLTPAGRPVSPLWVSASAVVMVVAIMFTASWAQSPAPGTLAPTIEETAANLHGRVLDASTGEPIPGARVQAQYITGVERPLRCPIGDCGPLSGPAADRVPIYQATTRSNGRFDIDAVKPGEYYVDAVAAGYVQRSFGQTANDMPPVSVYASPGVPPPSIDVRLEPAGSVSGRIFSDVGDGLPGVEVELLRRTYMPGGLQPVAVDFAQTEEGGAFSFRNVTAGEYLVRAYAAQSLEPTRGEGNLSYITTFFPDATDITFAQPLIVAEGQNLFGVNVALSTATLRTVSGQLVDPAGGSLATVTVNLIPYPNGSIEGLRTRPGIDGRFRITGVPPNAYMLTVMDTSGVRSWNGAVRDLHVVEDVTDLRLVAVPRVSLDGRIVTDDGRPLSFDPTDLVIHTEQRSSELGSHSAGVSDITAAGRFSMQSGTGTMHLRVARLPPPWVVKSVRLDGVDVTEKAFELVPGGRRRLEITLTDRVGRVFGTVTDRSARPVRNALVIAFPDDRARWTASSLIRTAFSHQQGRYEIDRLPASDYRVVAVTSLPRNAWTDPAVLDRLWSSASRVLLEDSGQHTLDLRVVSPPSELFR